MKYGLRTKLSLSYIFVTLVCVALITVLTNVFLEKQFKEYIIQKQENKNRVIVSQISQQYKNAGGWNGSLVEGIGVNALEDGMIVKVTDDSSNIVWDATVYNSGMCQQMIAHMSRNMIERYPSMKGGFVAVEYPVMNDLNEVGKVRIGYYGPYYYNDNDMAFINTLNKLLLGVGIFSLFFALVTGAVMAGRLSGPISRVTQAAGMISRGYFADRIAETSNTKEILQLTATINGLAETLEKQEVLRKRLTADVAHELRTPLATLQSHLEAMIDGIWKPDTERLKSCYDEVIRINRMVGDLEKLARYEGENLILDKSEFNISELVRHVAGHYEIEAANKGVDIEFHGVKEILYADRDKVSQVLINLLSNALKYTDAGGKIEIGVEGDEETVSISVRDSGTGIPAEDLPYIFERFYRADRSRNRMTGGAGIGLTISKAIVEAHKGDISVESKINAGTEFRVRLPKHAD